MPTKLKQRALSGVEVDGNTSRLVCVTTALLLIGCAASWKSVDPGMSLDAYRDLDVAAVVMANGQNVEFDATNPEGPEKGARFEGDVLRGYVKGEHVEVASSEIRQIRLVDSRTSKYVAVGVLFAMAVGVFVLVFFANPYEGLN